MSPKNLQKSSREDTISLQILNRQINLQHWLHKIFTLGKNLVTPHKRAGIYCERPEGAFGGKFAEKLVYRVFQHLLDKQLNAFVKGTRYAP